MPKASLIFSAVPQLDASAMMKNGKTATNGTLYGNSANISAMHTATDSR